MKFIALTTFALLLNFSTFCQAFIRSELPTALDNPWEITYGPDGFLWITEAEGIVSRVDPATGVKQVVYTAPDYFPGSPLENLPACTNPPILTGTLGLALHPDFLNAANSYIYFVYTYNSGSVPAPATKFRIKRLTWDAGTTAVVADSNVVDLIPTSYDHIGGRLMTIVQSGTPYLFLTIGDHGKSEINSPDCYDPQSGNPNNFTQDVTTQNGKIHRFNMDGSVPVTNPIPGNSFYTRGHRNPQGLMYNPNLDLIYDIEHGDRTDDEINVLHKGMNYGWKDIRGYYDDNSYPGEGAFHASYVPNPSILNDSLVDAFYSWCTTPDTSEVWSDWCTVAPSDGIYYGSAGIPLWTNSLLVVTLKDGLTTDREVYQFKLDAAGEMIPSTPGDLNPERFFGADQALNGRLRDITVSPDGQTIYLINNGGNAGDIITVYSYDPASNELVTSGQIPEIKLFPNPANDFLTLHGIDKLAGTSHIDVLTLDGVKIETKFLSQNKIDISSLVSGVYFVRLITEEGKFMLKFIKH